MVTCVSSECFHPGRPVSVPQVLREVPRGRERFGTLGTAEGFLAGVQPAVGPVGADVSEALPARLAHVRLVVRVRARVLRQRLLQPEALVAGDARVRLLARVQAHVPGQLAGGHEAPVAGGAGVVPEA